MKIQRSGFLLMCIFLVTNCEDSAKPDKIPPIIIITSPQDGSNVSGIVTISCEAMDNEGIEKVELWVDGIFTNESDSTEPYSFEWDTTPDESGSSHVFTLKAFDINGNVTESDSISLFAFITFVKNFSGSGSSVRQTDDEGYVTVGYTDSQGAGQNDLLVIKTDHYGNLIWEKTYGEEYNDAGTCIEQTDDGGYIITGKIEREDVDWPYWNHTFLWLLKTDSNGDTLWSKTYGHSGSSNGESVQQTIDGGYIVTGRVARRILTEGDSYGRQGCELIKTDAQGDTLWTKYFTGRGHTYGQSVIEVTDGGYMLINGVEVSGTGNYFQVIKTDSERNVIWLQEFGGVSDVHGYSVKQTSDDGFVITGGTSPYGGMYWDLILIKMDSQGNTIWNRTYGGGKTDGDLEIGYSVDQTTDGGYITAGFSTPNWDVLLLKTNSDGDTLWTNTFTWGDYPSISRGKSIQETIDGGFIITGYTDYGQNQSNLFLIKTDSEGDTVPYEN